MNIKKYYFPPVGFGFWFQFGALKSIQDNNYYIYGSSGGSIICLLSILKPEDRNFQNILFIFNKIRYKYKYNINLYIFINDFIKQIYIIIQTYDEKYIYHKLKNIFIEVSQIHTYYIFPYKITSSFIQPENLSHLRQLIIASCYVPLFTVYNYNPFFYTINKKKYFDGFFGSFSNHPDLIKINSYKYSTLIPRNDSHFRKIYYLGKNYNILQKNNRKFSIFTFIYISFNIFFDLILTFLSIFKNIFIILINKI
jgi:hypothetical protein